MQFFYTLPNGVGLEITATVYPGHPGKLNALPEDCYPPEDDIVEIERIVIENTDIEFDVDDLFLRSSFNKSNYFSLQDAIEEVALEEDHDG
jgi:hypothetical protein